MELSSKNFLYENFLKRSDSERSEWIGCLKKILEKFFEPKISTKTKLLKHEKVLFMNKPQVDLRINHQRGGLFFGKQIKPLLIAG